MNINTTLAILQDEVQYAVEEGIGNLPEFAPVRVFEKLLRIVALASGRVFVGRPLSRDEEWIQLTINYTVDASNAVKEVYYIPMFLRPLLVPFSPSIRKATQYRRRVAEKLKPQLKGMLEAHKRQQGKREDDDNDFDNAPGDEHNLATWSLVSVFRVAVFTAKSNCQVHPACLMGRILIILP